MAMPVGDPGGMRAFATTLRAKAEKIADGAQRAARAADSMHFEGPYANRVRSHMHQRAGRGVRLAQELVDLAALVTRSAATVEDEIRAELARREAARLAAEEKARKEAEEAQRKADAGGA